MNEELCISENAEFAVEAVQDTETEIAKESFEESEKNATDEEVDPTEEPKEKEEPPENEEKNELLCRIAELERKIEAWDRNSAQKKELLELFPDADPDDLPDSVSEQYEKGVPLAAAYALYKHMQKMEHRRAEEQSRKNGKFIPGELGNNTQNLYYTAEEVRAMSRNQVRMNFESILDSMRHW